ncbi:uncharacterized protein LOC135834686 isoform X2 [Planococcus citri]|uniref:uncharacterized protein LOC135834686 isoform X2 n=1 Tax=Planococcus citri TaxID=170843 RepID=UPI0031F7FAE6
MCCKSKHLILLIIRIFTRLFEYCDFVLLSYHIVFICSSGDEAVSILDISYFSSLWLLRFAPFFFLLFYVIVDAYANEKEDRNYLKLFLLFQSICLIKTLIISAVCLQLYDSNLSLNTDTFAEKGNRWLLFINSYSLLFFYFVQTSRPFLMGYLIQLGFNGYVLALICFQYRKFRSEHHRRNRKDVPIAIAIIGIDLVKF